MMRQLLSCRISADVRNSDDIMAVVCADSARLYSEAEAGFDAGFWNGAEKLNYYILFPALLINSLAVAPLDNPQLPKLAAALVIMLGLATAAFAVVRRFRGIPTAEFGVLLQGAIRFNTYLGLSIVNDFYGPSGMAVAAVILAVLVPLCNIISVVALSELKQLSLRRLLLPVLTNPLIISCIIGMLLNVSGIGLPYNTGQLARLLAGASLPLGLLCVGAALQVATIRYSALKISLNSVVRLCIMPLLAIAVAAVTGLTQLEYQLFVIFLPFRRHRPPIFYRASSAVTVS